MNSDSEAAEDVAAMMEALWGPRADGSFSPPRGTGRAAGADPPSKPATGDIAGPEEVDLQALPADLNVVLSEHMASVQWELERLEKEIEARMLTTEDLERLRSDIRAEIAEQLASIRAEQVDVRRGDAEVSEAVEASPAASVLKDDFVALRQELRTEVSRQMDAAQAELRRRTGALEASFAEAKTQMSNRSHEIATMAARRLGNGGDPLHKG